VTPCVSAFVATSTGCTLTGSSRGDSSSTVQDDKARALAVLAAAADANDHDDTEPSDDSSRGSGSGSSCSSSSKKGASSRRQTVATTGESSFTYALIARRSCERCGTRFLRGADTKGRVANFAETEQLVAKERKENGGIEGLSAHVQVVL